MMKQARVALLALACAACGDSPVGPRRPGERVAIGPVFEDAIRGGVDRNYSFATAANGE